MYFDVIRYGCLAAIGLMLFGCQEERPASPGIPQMNSGPPGIPQMSSGKVGIHSVVSTTQPVIRQLRGRTSAYMIAEIRPQVGGIIQKRLFTEGADVKIGQPLYQIAPQEYEAALAEAKANVVSAQATLHAAQLKAQRDQKLAHIGAISQETNDSSQAAYQEAAAAVKVAQAQVKTAQINLDYTRIHSPIAGRTATSSVTPGALVTAGQDTVLTTVLQLDPIYVDVTQTSSELLRLKRALAQGLLTPGAADNSATLKLQLEDGSTYEQTGTLTFNGTMVDEGTGSVTLRAVFPNPDHLLLPGMYVTAEIQEGLQDNAILVPQQGISRDERGQATAWVVEQGKVVFRQVELAGSVGQRWWVRQGLSAGDQLIVEGSQRVRAGQQVETFEADLGLGSD